MGGILQQALGDGDYLGGSSNASVIKDYKDSSILNNRFITCDYLIEVIAKISNYFTHNDIVPQKIKDLLLENDSLENICKIIAINAINFSIKDDKNQNKITNNNSAIYRDIYEAIDKEAKNKSPENEIKPLLNEELSKLFINSTK